MQLYEQKHLPPHNTYYIHKYVYVYIYTYIVSCINKNRIVYVWSIFDNLIARLIHRSIVLINSANFRPINQFAINQNIKFIESLDQLS